MKSYTQLRNEFGTDTKNSSATNLAWGDTLMNDWIRRLTSQADWAFLHRLRTANTVADTAFVNLPYDVSRVDSVFVTVSDVRYSPKSVPTREIWDRLNSRGETSDIPEYFYIYNGQIGLFPTPVTADNVISINAKISVPDLVVADITDTTITTLANGSTALTVSAGLTAQMAGFYIRPTLSSTANTGDGRWYEISSVTNATTAVLVREYGGVSITAGTAVCTISQMPAIPEEFQQLPEIYASYRYWLKENELSRANEFKSMLDRGSDDLFRAYASNTENYVLDDGEDDNFINPNLLITL